LRRDPRLERHRAQHAPQGLQGRRQDELRAGREGQGLARLVRGLRALRRAALRGRGLHEERRPRRPDGRASRRADPRRADAAQGGPGQMIFKLNKTILACVLLLSGMGLLALWTQAPPSGLDGKSIVQSNFLKQLTFLGVSLAVMGLVAWPHYLNFR